MFKLEESKKIGEYLSKLIDKKFNSKRKFCIAYIEADGRTINNEEIRKMANRISQMIQGKKSIQTYDLPIFTKLLEVSCEEILSAGKSFVPEMNRVTNYRIAFSKDKEIWEQYINREDKLILNSDEYGKTVIDYALKFKNFEFLKYLMEHKYIWFMRDWEERYGFEIFIAGTSIKRREFGYMDDLNWRLGENYNLRMKMISLAIEHNDMEILTQLHAREIPSLYQACYLSCTPPDCDKYYDEDMIFHITKASEQILDYFSEEFEIEDRIGHKNLFMFPYMKDLINLLIKNNHKYLEKLLKCCIEHNQKSYKKLKKLIKTAINSQMKRFCYTDDKKYIKILKDDVTKNVMKQLDFYDNGNIVSFRDIFTENSRGGMITNMVYIEEQSSDDKINSLIQELNGLCSKIHKIKF